MEKQTEDSTDNKINPEASADEADASVCVEKTSAEPETADAGAELAEDPGIKEPGQETSAQKETGQEEPEQGKSGEDDFDEEITEDDLDQYGEEEDADFEDSMRDAAERVAPTAEWRPLTAKDYFVYSLLFGIPLAGFVAALIYCFHSQNRNLQNFARGFFLWNCLIVGAAALIIGLGGASAVASLFV